MVNRLTSDDRGIGSLSVRYTHRTGKLPVLRLFLPVGLFPVFSVSLWFNIKRATHESMAGPALHHRPIRNRRSPRNGDDAFADHVGGCLRLLNAALIDQADIAADAAVLVDDGALDDAAVADAEVGPPALAVGLALGVGLEDGRRR